MANAIKAQLESADPAKRRQAIIALGKTQDERALPMLAHVYKTDPEPELRELARKAALHIRKNPKQPAPEPEQTPAFTSAPPFSSDPADYTYDPVLYDAQDDSGPIGYQIESSAHGLADWQDESPYRRDSFGAGLGHEEVPVSPTNVDRARRYADRAFTLHQKGDRLGAVKEMGRALELNPNLPYNDPMTLNLAGEIVGIKPIESVALLEDKERREEFIRQMKGIEAPVKGARGGGTASWGDVWFEIALLFLVTAIGFLVYMLLVLPSMFGDLAAVDPELSGLTTMAPMVAITTALAVALYSVVSGFISNVAIHFAAVMFGGEGAIPETFHALLPVQIGVSIGIFGIYALIGLVPDIFTILSVVVMGLSIGGLYWMSQRLAAVHGFGAASGCGAMIAGPILLAILMCVGIFIFTSLLGISAGALMPSLLVLPLLGLPLG